MWLIVLELTLLTSVSLGLGAFAGQLVDMWAFQDSAERQRREIGFTAIMNACFAPGIAVCWVCIVDPDVVTGLLIMLASVAVTPVAVAIAVLIYKGLFALIRMITPSGKSEGR